LATSPLSTRRNRWTFTACWILWSAVHYVMLRNFDIPWHIALTDAIGSNALLAGATILIIHTLGYYRPDNKNYFYLLVWCVVISVIWTAVVKLALISFFSDDQFYKTFLLRSIPVRFDMAFLVVGCSVIMSMLWYSLDEKKHVESRKAASEKLARDAELYKLRQQLQPHFLFNTLNNIYYEAYREAPRTAGLIPSPQAVPEPASGVLTGLLLAGMAGVVSSRRLRAMRHRE